MTHIGYPFTIFANAVYSSHIALIFYRPRHKQLVPRIDPCGGPVRDKYLKIGVVGSAPYRKPQVVTNLGHNPPTLKSYKNALFPRRKGMVFVGHPEQVALIVLRLDFPIFGPEKAVEKLPIAFNHHTSAKGNFQISRLRFQP